MRSFALDLRAQIARLFARFLGRLLEQRVRFGQHVGEILDQRFAAAFEFCGSHVRLHSEQRRNGRPWRRAPGCRLAYYSLAVAKPSRELPSAGERP